MRHHFRQHLRVARLEKDGALERGVNLVASCYCYGNSLKGGVKGVVVVVVAAAVVVGGDVACIVDVVLRFLVVAVAAVVEMGFQS